LIDKKSSLVAEVFERALGIIRTRVCVSASGEEAIGIACSGGLDSSALLQLAADYAKANRFALFAFHIHHGISPKADEWLAHCQSECKRLGIEFDARRVKLGNPGKGGIEEAARIVRYAALGELCRAHRVTLLLTAHHQDDQAETILLQLLRGSGVAGMTGMEEANTAPGLLGDSELVMGRPLLALSRADLAKFVEDQEIAHIEDESNADTRYARNALRHQVMPGLVRYFPGFQQRLARAAVHVQSAQRLLVELAVMDLAACMDGECVDMNRLRPLGPDRIDNLLRYWFGTRGLRMPSTAWLAELRSQLFGAKEDAQLCVTHPDCQIRRYRDRVFITPRFDENAPVPQPALFRWNGALCRDFPEFGGILHFDATGQGMDADWLARQDLTIRLRCGGERLKLASNRPTKSLKYHYQSFDVPPWERARLPVVLAGTQLLFAAAIGMDCHHLSAAPGTRIQLRWQLKGVTEAAVPEL
jgi:tRNA(Ile)-lysidine synthase